MMELSVIVFSEADRALGRLAIGTRADGLVIYARPPGERKPEDESLPAALRAAGLATLTLRPPAKIALSRYARLITQAARWTEKFLADTGIQAPLALYGSGAGADAALLCAIRLGTRVRCVVCRDAQPDRVVGLERLRVPVLFLLPERDEAGRARYLKTAHLVPGAELGLLAPGSADRSIGWLEGQFEPEIARGRSTG